MIYYTDISPLAHRHATDMLATVDPKVAMDTSAECRPTVYVWSPASINRHSTGGVSAKINRLWTDWRPICGLSLDRVSIDYRSRVDRGSIEMSVEGIDRYSIADALTTHDPLLLSLQNTRTYLLPDLKKWSEVLTCGFLMYNKEFLVKFQKINDWFTKAFETERRLSDLENDDCSSFVLGAMTSSQGK